MLPDDWKDQIGGHDAIYFGAVGWPDKIPDHVSLWGSLLMFRREFDQYINLRPARLMPGIVCPVVRRDGSPRQPGEIDFYIVRENTEGEYSSIGGRPSLAPSESLCCRSRCSPASAWTVC